MKTLFQAVVVQIGEMVEDIAKENILIFFDAKAPKELHDVAVLHEGGSVVEDVRVGDRLMIDDKSYEIIFVGDKVNSALRDLGHVSVKFGGATEDMPGSICVRADQIPVPSVGDVLQFVRG
jgi:PTS system glucitol/sorbitol-specific IIA component